MENQAKPKAAPRKKSTVTPAGFIANLFKKARDMRKKSVLVTIKKGDDHVQELSDELSLKAIIKDQVVKEIAEIKKRQVEESLKAQELILNLVDEANKKFNELTGSETTLNDGLNWFSLDELLQINYSKSLYAVPNENLAEAEREFNAMIKQHNYAEDDPFVQLAKVAFKVSSAGRVDTKAVQKLRRANFDIKKYPEWSRIRTLLSDCYEYQSRKMCLNVSERESLKHKWELITDR